MSTLSERFSRLRGFAAGTIGSFGSRLGELAPEPADLAAMRRNPRQDLLAGLTVAVVALPLALAFGVASGLGAQAGLVTAVIAGIVASVFGGSNLQVSGPTGAMTVVLVPVVHAHGAAGVLMVGVMAGIVLIAMAMARFGGYVRFLPVPVIEGFTAGIAVVIALQQVPAALGITDVSGDRVWRSAADAVGQFAHHPHITPLVVALAVAALMLVGARWKPGIPFSLIGVIAVTIVGRVFDLKLAPLGHLPASLPAPSIDFIDLGAVGSLIPPALAVAALAALESLLCATVADGMSVNERHDPDRELFGQGMANVVVPVFGGVAATAALARTAVNVRAGARSRLAAITHSVVLVVVIFAAAPLVSDIPLAALAGVLFATCVRMIEAGSIRTLMRATRSDALIVALTFTVTVAVDLVTAVGVGVGVAVILALREVARSARLEVVSLEAGDHSAEEHALLSEHIVAYRLDGPLFFAAAHRVLLELPDIADVQIVILRMSRVTTIDATGAQVLGDAITKLEHRGITVMLSGITERHHDVLAALGVAQKLRREGLVFPGTPEAIAHARDLLALPATTKNTDV
ncbi:SulP family inorganic anion transporter [Aeromicrobium sp.]|uniref:SulP family inorganic anion transporter n=1 Tax=Aeromicrobium sp. TaxID=1871063 RepID=UPI002FC9F2C9